MPGKQARVLCPVCQEPIPPDETECGNCGAFVIDEAVVRLSRAFGLDRDRALKLFEAGFRHPTQLRDRDPNRVLEKGEVGLLFICTNCGGFVGGADSKCPRCAAEFESEPEAPAVPEEDILDLILCPACGADNDPEVVECEICGETLREAREPGAIASTTAPVPEPTLTAIRPDEELEKVDDFLQETERPAPESVRAAVREPVRVEASRAVPKVTPPTVSRDVASAHRSVPSTPVQTSIPKTLPVPIRRKSAVAPSVQSVETLPRRTPKRLREGGKESVKLPEPAKLPSKATTRKNILNARPNRLPRKKVRASPSEDPLTPEAVAGLALSAAAGLLLAGALGQALVSAGIAVLVAALGVYVSIGLLRGRFPRPSRVDGILLATGMALGLSAPALRGGPVLGATGLVLAAAFLFAWATQRVLRTPQRILLAVGSAVPLIGHALAAFVDPTYPTKLPWIVGLVASMPWPAALASVEILRRKSATVLRRQIIRAERDVQRKNYEQSLTEYDRAIAAASKDVPGAEIPWYGKGATLILLGRYEEALRAIDRALDINPRNEVAWVNKGNALTRMGQVLDALRCFNAAIKVNPLYEVAWNNKGNALARLGKHDEALRCYERALGIDPGYRGAWVNMGFVLTKLGRFDEAASCADQALRLDSGRRPEPA